MTRVLFDTLTVHGRRFRMRIAMPPLIRVVVTARYERQRRGAIERPGSNSIGAVSSRAIWARSMASIRNLVVIPPLAENPPVLPLAASTRWHGTTIGNG